MLYTYEPVRALCGSEARFRLLKALYEDPRKAFHLRGLAAVARVDPAQARPVLLQPLPFGRPAYLAANPAPRSAALVASLTHDLILRRGAKASPPKPIFRNCPHFSFD